MKTMVSIDNKSRLNRKRWLRSGDCSGLSLVEVVVSFAIFTLIALGTITAIIQCRKMSEDNVAQATALIIAQGILEQVQLPPWATLTDPTLANPTDDPNGIQPNYTFLRLNFTGMSTNTLASIEQNDLKWGVLQPIGAWKDPTDHSKGVLGVLMDTTYMNGATLIRPARYMQMSATINRTIHLDTDSVEVVLTYSWAPPSRNMGVGQGGTPVFITREIRTVRSQANSY